MGGAWEEERRIDLELELIAPVGPQSVVSSTRSCCRAERRNGRLHGMNPCQAALERDGSAVSCVSSSSQCLRIREREKGDQLLDKFSRVQNAHRQ